MIELIPAIDIIDGRCVRLSQGDFDQKTVYNDNPVEVALYFESKGIRRLHLVDLDGAKSGSIKNLRVLESIARATNLAIDFSGGIHTEENVTEVFNAGASIIAIGSLAFKEPDTVIGWAQKYGSEKMLIGADVSDEKIVTKGWLNRTDLSVFDFIDTFYREGIYHVFCTDISKDGMMEGISVPLYKSISGRFPRLNLIASGGVRDMADIRIAEEAGCKGIIVGKALYEGKINL